MDIKLVIFDFDGTIADTREAIIMAKQKTMKRMGLEVADEKTCASTIGLSAKRGFQITYPNLTEQELDLCVSNYRSIFEEIKEQYPPVLFPEVVKTLDFMKEKGITTTLATSRNNASLGDFLVRMNLAEYFPYALGGQDTEHLKPDPEPVLKTLRDLSFRSEQTLVIGDMWMDIEMGKRAGAYTCGVTYGNSDKAGLHNAGADYVIDRMSEIMGVLS